MGGFECSSHRRRDGCRLDMIEATQHDKFARNDYAKLAEFGMRTARDGLRWHLIEDSPGKYDFSSVTSQADAALESRVQVIWDLFHYGYPQHIDIFSTDFASRLADLGASFAEFHVRLTGNEPLVIPVNEISFFSWIAGDIGRFYPFATGRGRDLKRNLASAAITAARSIKSIAPGSKIIASEPLVYVTSRDGTSEIVEAAESYRMSQYEAFDMLTGRLAPELGGDDDCLDVIGVNYYPHNQWYYPDREMIPRGDLTYKPLREMLLEVSSRYELPIFIAETGTENDERSGWFRYVTDECRAVLQTGKVNLQGVCLYPIVNHPGWEDERHCHNGLLDYCDDLGKREIHKPLALEMRRLAQDFDHHHSTAVFAKAAS